MGLQKKNCMLMLNNLGCFADAGDISVIITIGHVLSCLDDFYLKMRKIL
jgi:hypothetical protein